jgi:hypothetical protein
MEQAVRCAILSMDPELLNEMYIVLSLVDHPADQPPLLVHVARKSRIGLENRV